MSFDHIIAVIGVLIGVSGFAYGVWKDRKTDHQFRKDKVDALYKDLLEIMTRGMGGVYIPGMSEKAGEQLKARVRSTLRWHLLPEDRSEDDKQIHKIAQQLKIESKR